MARRRYRQKTKKELKELDRLVESGNPVYAEFRKKVANYSYEKLKAEENTLLREQELLPARIIKLEEEAKVKDEEWRKAYYKANEPVYRDRVINAEQIAIRTEAITKKFYSNPVNKLKDESVKGIFFPLISSISRKEHNKKKLKELNNLIETDEEIIEIQNKDEKTDKEISEHEEKWQGYRRKRISLLEKETSGRKSILLTLLVTILPELIKTARKKEKDARYSAVLGEARNSSQSIKETLSSSMNDDWACPYCNQVKEQKTAEADHIYPVSKGGQSTPQNMVIVCYDCNRAKRDFSLRHFCKVSDFNFEEVADRLESLGNEI